MPKLSIVDVAPLDAMSSSGVRASDGSKAWSAGRMSVTANPSKAANANTSDSTSAIERDRRRSEGNGCDQRQSEEETLPREAVAQGRGKRRHERCGQETNEAGEADRSRSADVIGVHAECDEVRPLRRDGRAPGQLCAPDVRVPKS